MAAPTGRLKTHERLRTRCQPNRVSSTESTWHRWRRAYGGMSPSHARRLKELEVENARLKKLLAEAELDKAMLKELAEGKW